jgi:asparagine synthase (glutamine-hydrolysing)
MCGIVGIASSRPIESRDWLVTGRDQIIHRGPDGAGMYWSDDHRVGLAHRRLAIIDLSEEGAQPMRSRDGSVVITYNGEVYNFQALRAELLSLGHSFRSTSDTEVILQAYQQWGSDCIQRFQGMFAFAIHDRTRNRILCARDRAGEKPFFYHHANGTIRFGSELKALLVDPTLPRRIEPAALDYYLAFGYVPGEQCLLQGFRKLPPAHALEFDLASGALKTYRYWNLPDYVEPAGPMNEGELLEELERLMETAVRRQLIADVPVGLLLSGGVDSSLITALAARSGTRLKTFTVGFPETPEYDETAHAALIAKAFDTDHTVMQADVVTVDLMGQLAKQFDEPIVDSSMIPTFLVTQQISRQCKVALGGDGGDELFGGYRSASQIAKYHQQLSAWPLMLRKPIAKLAGSILPYNFPRRWSLLILGMDTAHDLIPIQPKLDAHYRRQLMGSSLSWPTPSESFRASRIPQCRDPVQRMTRFDFLNYMPEDILVKVDRSSMLNSLEVRAPFLDVPVIEFAYRHLPSSLKATPVDRKIMLKRLAARILPKDFDRQRKKGFGIPIGKMICQGPWRTKFEEVLFDSRSLFSQDSVRNMFQRHLRGFDYADNLFALCLLELWRREYRVEL